jgi:serine/threonine protein kinase
MPVTFDLHEVELGVKTVTATLESKSYSIGRQLFTGDFCNIYACSIPEHVTGSAPTWYDRIIEDEGARCNGVLKVVRSKEDNDLLDNEARILSKLFPKSAEDVKFYRYLPRLIEHFQFPSLRGASVLPLMEGYVPLANILQAYPTGVDFRDMVWMFKRTLVGIGFAHKHGVVHGAILPPHVLVHPTDHGAKLLDWSFAIEAGDHIHGISGSYRDFYPSEVFDKEKATPATDIYMAAKCCVALLGGDVKTNGIPDTVPNEVKVFLEGCLVRSASRRPQDAWELHEVFDQLLLKLVGKPTYRPLTMP